MKLCHLKLSILIVFTQIIATASFVPSASAIQYGCKETPAVLIFAANDKMVGHVCKAAGRATGFLEKYQLKPKRSIHIEIVEEAINQDGYMAFGSYDRQSDRILMMSLTSILQSRESATMYDMPFDKEHYRGAIAHEIAHAVFNHNATNIKEKWNNAAQEYLAHVTQLSVLSAQRREDILISAKTGPWESGDEISVTYMGVNATGFAVKSYLHLTQLNDPQPFIQLLLNHKWLYISVP